MDAKSLLAEQIDRIRSELDNEELYNSLNQRQVWFEVCAALDTVDNVDLAFAAFGTHAIESPDVWLGQKYLTLYGILQSFQLLIDAVNTVCIILNGSKNFRREKFVLEALEIRQLMGGHPIRPKEDGRKFSAYTNQIELESGQLKVTLLGPHPEDGFYFQERFYNIGEIKNGLAEECTDALSLICKKVSDKK